MLDEAGSLIYCRLVDGALFSKPQRLMPLENALIGRRLDEAMIKEAEDILKQMLDEAIGKRWSAAYKVPVGVEMLSQMLQEALAENH
nr:hypothetical protein [Mixta intestinalis]